MCQNHGLHGLPAPMFCFQLHFQHNVNVMLHDWETKWQGRGNIIISWFKKTTNHQLTLKCQCKNVDIDYNRLVFIKSVCRSKYFWVFCTFHTGILMCNTIKAVVKLQGPFIPQSCVKSLVPCIQSMLTHSTPNVQYPAIGMLCCHSFKPQFTTNLPLVQQCYALR